jgi:maltoporin
MRSNRLSRYFALAATTVAASTASAQTPAPDTAPPADPTQPTAAPPAPPPAPAPVDTSMPPAAPTPPVVQPTPGHPVLEFAGYFRAGVGLNVKGGGQLCFGLAGADTKWRLGNECDYVIEPQFTARLVTLQDGSKWGFVFMPGLYRTWQDLVGPSFSNIPTEFRQVYLFGENMPALANGRIWGGRRYYDRLHLDINDQFLEIEDGDGAGIEEMNLGFGKLSVAFLMNPNAESHPSTATGGASTPSANIQPFKVTARLTDIPTTPKGNLQLWTAFYGNATSDDESGNGATTNPSDSKFRFAAYHTLNEVIGTSNLIGAKVEYGKNHQLYRGVVQEQVLLNQGHANVDFIAEYRYVKDRLNDATPYASQQWFSIGARGDTQLKGPFRFIVEAGLDRVTPESGDSPMLVKTTACLALNAGDRHDARPEFRLFYTHGFWNDAAKTSPLGVFALGQDGKLVQQVYGNASNGGSVGIQAEAWW